MQIRLRFYSFNWKYYPMWSVINDAQRKYFLILLTILNHENYNEKEFACVIKSTTNMSYAEI